MKITRANINRGGNGKVIVGESEDLSWSVLRQLNDILIRESTALCPREAWISFLPPSSGWGKTDHGVASTPSRLPCANPSCSDRTEHGGQHKKCVSLPPGDVGIVLFYF